MIQSFLLTSTFALLSLLQTACCSNLNQRAIVPTASGQIGINPVTDLGEPSKWIGVNTQYLTDLVDDGRTTYKWIGVNTEYLTENVAPVVSDSKTIATVTTSVGAVASTATADGNGLKTGDVSVTFSPALIAKLKTLAAKVCGAPSGKKLRVRDGGALLTRAGESCAYEFAHQAAGPGGPLEFDFDLPTITAADVAAVVSAIGNTVVPASGAAGFAVLLWYLWEETGDMPNTVNVPKEDIGPKPDLSNPASNQNTATTTNSACPSGSNSPVCQNSKLCNSPDEKKCTTSVKYENCDCLPYAGINYYPATPEYLAAAQSVLGEMASVVSNAPAMGTMGPKCMADGAPWMLPTSWCDCGPSSKYETLPPKSDATDSSANCDYTTLPTKTIDPSSNSASPAPTNKPGQNGVSGCAYYLAANQGLPDGTPNYCFCGGGPDVPPANAPLLTHTDVDPPKTDCNYDTQPTPGWEPKPPEGAESPGPEKPTCGAGYGDKWNMRQATATSEASAYCSAKATEAAKGAKIANNWPGTCAQQNKDAVYQPPAEGQVEAGMSNIVFSVQKDNQVEYCKKKDYGDLKFSEDDCNKALSMAINGCNTDTVDEKHGGTVSINCLIFGVRPAPFGNGYPCFGQFCSYGWVDDCSPRG